MTHRHAHPHTHLPYPARGILASALACLWLLVAPAAVTAQQPAKRADAHGPIEGVIHRVTDGDSLWLQPAGKPAIEVRLRDIDAPEICQDYGPDAKKALEQMALGKTATLTISARDAHGRSIGQVMVEGQSLSRMMVAEGHAWSTRSRYDRGPLMKEERMAIALRRGVHATSGAVMPKDFRKAHGPCK
jgi:endonuclease YncB( thermonuclease family)